MESKYFSAVFLVFSIFFSNGCTKESKIDPNPTPYMVSYNFVGRPYWQSWPDKGVEINVNANIYSQFSDDAFIVLSAVKIYSPYTVYHVLDKTTKEYLEPNSYVHHPHIYEGFKDSLKIDGFDIRSYMQYRYFEDGGDFGIFVGTPVDFPVYFKKISLIKGTNKENFKIVFPRERCSIPGEVIIYMGIGRFNDEMKIRFENFPDVCELRECELTGRDKSYANFYFETFPDSSKTSLVFSNFELLEKMSLLPEASRNITGRYYFNYYPSIRLWYPDAPELRYDEFIYR